MDDHMTLLHDHFLFQGAEELLHEAQTLGVSRFSRGDTICDPATSGRALGIVLEGRTEAVAPTREKAVLAVFGPGGTFGAAALFGGDGYVSRIRAVTACAVVLLPEELLRPALPADGGELHRLSLKPGAFSQRQNCHLYPGQCPAPAVPVAAGQL